MAEEVYVINMGRAKLSAHTPRRKLALALLKYEFGDISFTEDEALEVLSREGLLEGDSKGSLWGNLISTGFVCNPYEMEV